MIIDFRAPSVRWDLGCSAGGILVDRKQKLCEWVIEVKTFSEFDGENIRELWTEAGYLHVHVYVYICIDRKFYVMLRLVDLRSKAKKYLWLMISLLKIWNNFFMNKFIWISIFLYLCL